MSVSNQQLLDAARSALQKRLNGDAYNAYKTEEMEFVGMPIDKLLDTIDRLEVKVADGGNMFIEGAP